MKPWINNHLALHQWNFMRLLRLILGLAIVVQSSLAKDWWFVAIGLFLTGTALFNIGCCGTQGCAVKPGKHQNPAITYEEVDGK